VKTETVSVPGFVVPKINPEYEKLVPPLPEIEYKMLRDSIKEKGQYETIKINRYGVVLDGHRRLRICQELGIQPHFETLDFKNEAEERCYVIEVNLRRRQLTDYQKVELSKELLEFEKRVARIRQASKLLQNQKVENEHDLPLAPIGANGVKGGGGKATEKVATKLDIPTRTYEKALAVIEKAPAVIKEKAREGRLSIEKAYKQTKALELVSPEEKPRIIEKLEKGEAKDVWDARTQVRKDLSSNYRLLKNDAVELECGDFTKLYKNIKENSVALILTDLPYARKYLPLWEELGKVAKRVLLPGGYLIAYTGGMFLPDVLDALGKNLRWYWYEVVKHNSGTTQLFHREVRNRCKLAVIFTKGEKPRDHEWFYDLIEGEKGNKEEHEWAQGEKESDYLVSKFTLPGDIVLDPCMGVGTFLVAAKKLGRKVIGFEINREYFDKALEALTDVKGSGKKK
jgi:SAM-dependent methyltransferase